MLDVKNLIVLHDSLIPRYRGYAPLVSALVNGEREVGVTALLGAPEIDHGDVIAQKSLAVCYPAKINDVIDRIAKLYSEIVLELVAQLKATGSVTATPQDHTRATYSLWRDEEDYNMDWTASAERSNGLWTQWASHTKALPVYPG
jgi:methionyl-tRNA formyltransferase